MPRKCKRGWIREYSERLEAITGSPLLYHTWTALTLIGATLKRHIWYDRVAYRVYPNLYTVLVGRPGIGKGVAANAGIALIREARTVNILSDRLTMEYVLEKMSKGFVAPQSSQGGMKLVAESSVLLVSTELSVFITASQFALTALTDLWEGREGEYMYGTRGRGEWNVKSPCVSLLGASAQEYLIRSIPADAIGGGFTRRVNFVFEKKESKKIAFPERDGLVRFNMDLIDDLKAMSLLTGEIRFEDAARKKFEDYYNKSEAGEFDDQATANYKTSRWSNALKVAINVCIAESDRLVITEQHWDRAVNLIAPVIDNLKLVFRAVGESDLASAADKALQFIEKRGFASMNELLFYLWKDVTREDLERILTTFREAGILGERTMGNKTIYFVTGASQP